MLTGEFFHNMDAKKRLFMPARLREELSGGFVLWTSPREKCLKIYSPEDWAEMIDSIRTKLKGSASEQVVRTLSRTACEMMPDEQGRIVLPDALVKHAEIEKSTVIVGCGKYGEIWSEANYRRDVLETEDLAKLNEVLDSIGL